VLRRATALVDYRAVEVEPGGIRLARPGMALTLNGIAPGYLTDRIVELLKNEGFDDVLVDLGEIRAAGAKGDGDPWRAGLPAPAGSGSLLGELPLTDEALATSAPAGFQFDPAGRFHHIFDPRSGACPQRYASVSIVAPAATVADALATAFLLLPMPAMVPAMRATGARQAIIVDQAGTVTRLQA
jgi:thiamine biosynthesis lipoprotein